MNVIKNFGIFTNEETMDGLPTLSKNPVLSTFLYKGELGLLPPMGWLALAEFQENEDEEAYRNFLDKAQHNRHAVYVVGYNKVGTKASVCLLSTSRPPTDALKYLRQFIGGR